MTEDRRKREAERRVRYAQREMVDGRLVAPGRVRHGTVEAYAEFGCRCRRCERAAAQAS
jgi:hypothetical protein